VLMHHGLVSFGETARIAYERMVELVTLAEQYLVDRGAWEISTPPVTPIDRPLRRELAALRREVSTAARVPLIMATHVDAQCLGFAQRYDRATISQQGPATPDHVIRTKRLPQLGRDVAAYARAYEEYFTTCAQTAGRPLTMLDPAPRIILDPTLGMSAIGRTVRDAAIAEDIYRHTMDIVLRATALGGYRALPARDLFNAEYWDLEQAKLLKGGAAPIFSGEVALVTGAASGIGKACVESLLLRGAAVAALDLNPAVSTIFGRPDVLGLGCDVTDAEALERALEATVRKFGGLDMVILNAGIFQPSRPIAALPLAEWRRSMSVNLDANLILMREAHPLLTQAPRGGRVALIGSKNVTAPGPGAAAYSAAKAALTQLARVAALEWGSDGIRVNVLHPDAVFDTGLWTDEVLRARAANYGMTVEHYKTKNVLRVEITS
ncbi:MAG: SDR family NAD(P)-dependent oxidoreductase, partial [Chloroflexota bacterium]